MALFPSKFTGQERLQPGARGEKFGADLPGYRNSGDDRVNRTNNKLATNAHDVPNVKYELDRRLPVLFKYGYAYGYNQIVLPKGRLVSADPFMNLLDFDMRHAHNSLTIANGGAPVRLRKDTDTYMASKLESKNIAEPVGNVHVEWIPLKGLSATYTDTCYRPLKTADNKFDSPMEQLKAAGYKVDEKTGRIINVDGTPAVDVIRPGNVPLGVMQRNEYTRNDDAFNGIMPGAVLTDAMIELPWFAFKDKAEGNPWGSAYGAFLPGTLVKSDENGRFIPSPLSFESELTTMSIPEYELERQQIVGQVYSVDNNLIPEGSYKWATWALEDRLKFNEFNPDVYRQNNRDGEDAINNSAYNSTGEYPGYPYDRTITTNDLHMLSSTLRNADNRLDPRYQYENLGIPGLTDGGNVATRKYPPERAGLINYAHGKEYTEIYLKTSQVNIKKGSLKIALGDFGTDNSNFTPCVNGIKLTANVGADKDTFIEVKYADELQGIIVLKIFNKAKADAFLQAHDHLQVSFMFDKAGLAGVPTFMDWDGCVGSVMILLQK